MKFVRIRKQYLQSINKLKYYLPTKMMRKKQ